MADAARACARRIRRRRHAVVLWTGGVLSALGLIGAIHIIHAGLRSRFTLAAQLDLAMPASVFAIGLLLLWHGRVSFRLGRQLAGVLVATSGAVGLRLLIVLLDASAGSLTYLLDHFSVPGLLVLASPAVLGCGLLMVFAAAPRSEGRRCRRPQRRASASARPKSPP